MKKIEDMLDFKFLSDIKSNNKDKFLAILHKIDEENNTYTHNLVLYKNNNFYELTQSNKDTNAIFDDENTILFISSRNENNKEKKEEFYIQNTDFYRINTECGEAKKAFSLPVKVTDFRKINNNNYLIVANYDFNYNFNEKNYIKANFKEEVNYIPLYDNGTTYNYNDRSKLLIYDEKNDKLIDIFKDNKDKTNYKISDIKGDKALIIENYYNDYGRRMQTNNLIELDLNSLKYEYLLKEKEISIKIAFYQKNEIFAFISTMKEHGINENPKVYKISKNNYEFILDNEFSIINSTGSDCRYGNNTSFINHNDEFYFLSTRNYYCNVFKFSNNKISQVTKIDGSVETFTFINNKFILLAMFKDALADFYDYNLEKHSYKKISNFNNFENPYIPEHFTYESNNDTLDGFVIYPKNYDKNKKYPAVLDIHGGPKTVYSDILYFEMQLLADRGYFVIFTNPHGSCGRDNKFMNIFGEYGTRDYQDLMNFTDICIEKYNIDKNNMAVMGGSYGGFMTNWIITHTNRFKAAVTQRSICNWISKMGVSDIGFYFNTDQNNTSIDDPECFDKLWNASPLKYIDNAKTPTLIIHSDEDYRCTLEQGIQLFTALKERKVDTKLVIYKGENHELSRSGKYKGRYDRLSNMISFIDKYIKN